MGSLSGRLHCGGRSIILQASLVRSSNLSQSGIKATSEMVGKKRKKRRSKSTLGNHQRGWLWGRHAVLETLRAGRWRPYELLVCDELLEAALLKEILQRCDDDQIPLGFTDANGLEDLVRARDHQGVAARMPEFPLKDFEELVSELPERPFLLILDRIQDPYNFGSILRSADLFGVDGIIIGDREQAGISSHVTRSSSGAVNYLNITQVESLPAAAQQLQSAGIELISASEKAETSPAELDLTQGAAIIIGNEGAGVASELMEQCTTLCAIPQTGHVDSLNAAVAAGILCYEVQRQRRSS